MWFILALKSEGSYGGDDSYVHYRISHYAFKYPYLFFDQWGKPAFTFFSSPFSYFGFLGIKVFNITIATLTAFLCYLIASKLDLKYPILVIIFVCFSCMYFIVAMTGLTEIFFSFIIILAVYLFLNHKHILSAFVISFLPYARQEGYMIIGIFLIVLIIRRQFKAIPFLASAYLIFSTIYLLYFHKVFGLGEMIPYSKAVQYGSGDLLHFARSTKSIFGNLLLVLFLAGIVNLAIKVFKKPLFKTPFLIEEVVLIFGIFASFFVLHSILWWKGLYASLGLIRVIVGVLPLAAILCLEGLNFFIPLISFNRYFKIVVIAIVLIFVIREPFHRWEVPVPLDNREVRINEVANWLVENKYDQKTIYYYETYLIHVLKKDPFNSNDANERVPDKDEPSKDIQEGSIIVWDKIFGEYQMPLKNLLNDSKLELIKTFNQSSNTSDTKECNDDVYVFQRK